MSSILETIPTEFKPSCERYVTGWDGNWGIIHMVIFYSLIMLVGSLIMGLLSSLSNGSTMGVVGTIIGMFVSIWFHQFFWTIIFKKKYHQVLCTSSILHNLPSFVLRRFITKPTL